MKGLFKILTFASLAIVAAGGEIAVATPGRSGQALEDPTPEAGGEHFRWETARGPLHLWRPENYDPQSAGLVIYVHGYHTTVDQAWIDDDLAAQFQASGRNALFIAVAAPQSNREGVSWESLDELLNTVEERAPFALPSGPLVVAGHSAAYRTILPWLNDARVQYVILLDGLYAGQAEFHDWLRTRQFAKPHRMVLVSNHTWRQSNLFARRTPGAIRRTGIPISASHFTARETHARLLYLRSQYNHDEMIRSGKVIPILLQIAPLGALSMENQQQVAATQRSRCWHQPCKLNSLPPQ